MVEHVPLGKADYLATLHLQQRLHALRLRERIADTVLSVEHNAVVTMGRSSSAESLLVSAETLAQNGIEVFRVERGGDVTYHGPGQLVLYPILHMRRFNRDVRRFVWTLEESVITALGAVSVAAERRMGYPGVWVGARKIASLGVYVKRWVTYHGLALNVRINEAHFQMIRPCGLPVSVVSVNDLTDESITLAAMREELLQSLASVWGVRLRTLSQEEVTQIRREASFVDPNASSHS